MNLNNLKLQMLKQVNSLQTTINAYIPSREFDPLLCKQVQLTEMISGLKSSIENIEDAHLIQEPGWNEINVDEGYDPKPGEFEFVPCIKIKLGAKEIEEINKDFPLAKMEGSYLLDLSCISCKEVDSKISELAQLPMQMTSNSLLVITEC